MFFRKTTVQFNEDDPPSIRVKIIIEALGGLSKLKKALHAEDIRHLDSQLSFHVKGYRSFNTIYVTYDFDRAYTIYLMQEPEHGFCSKCTSHGYCVMEKTDLRRYQLERALEDLMAQSEDEHFYSMKDK